MGKALLLTSTHNPLSSANGNYTTPAGTALNQGTTEARFQAVTRLAGTISLLGLSKDDTNGTSYTIRARINGADGNQSVNPANGSAAGVYEDASNSDSVSAGDKLSVSTAESGTNPQIRWHRLVFEKSTGHGCLYACLVNSNVQSASTTVYAPISGAGSTGAEAARQCKVRSAGTLTGGYVYVQSNARTNTTTWKSRVNGADGNVSIAVTSGATGLFEDTSNTDTLASGDDINWSITTGAGTETLTPSIFGTCISNSSTQNDLWAASGSGQTRAASATASYLYFTGGSNNTTTENRTKVQHGFDGTASRLRIYISANTYSADGTATFRKNGGDGNQTITLTAGATGLFEDTTHTDDFDEDDDCNVKIVGGTSGSITYNWVGITEAPTLPTQDLTPGLVTNDQTFYAATVSATYALTPGLFTNSQTFHAPTVTPGAVDLTPSLVTNTSTIYAPEIASGWALSPGLLTNTQTFYAATVTVGGVELAPSLVTNGQTFYGPTITAGAVDLAPGVVTNSQAFYSATITTGAVTVAPPLYTNSQTFYGPAVTSVYPLAPSLLTNSQTFYGASIAVAPVYLTPSLFTNTQTFFQHSFRAITGKSASTTVSVTGQGAGQTVSGWVGKTSEEAVSGWVGKSAA